MALARIRKHWRGFVPPYFAHSTGLCAYYHCTRERADDRRYCHVHARMYDLEAKEEPTKILEFKNADEEGITKED